MTAFPFDLVAFDLDGTLADTMPDIAAAVNRMLADFGRAPLAEAAVRPLVGDGARNLLRKALAATGDAPDALVDQAYPLYLDHYAAHVCDGTLPFPHAAAALDGLAAMGVRLAICTNKGERVTGLLLDALGWTERFAAIVCGDSLPVLKPDPRMLHETIARAGGGRAAFVGDSIIDAETARAAGLPFVAVSFGFRDRPADALGADAVIDSYADLITALRRIAG
ncbi:MAG TPA: phosphoglycolate phosphatase [Allosphingosinicella sp.]|nr:phosphoglycolate phosphatase [Allosphingosinicella sp.]